MATTRAKPRLPGEIPGLELWLDGADTGTLVSKDGSISRWMDKNGRANDAVQTLSSHRPSLGTNRVAGLSVVSFDGANGFLVFPRLSDTHTVFWVVEELPEATDDYRPFLGDSSYYDFHRGDDRILFSDVYAPRVSSGMTRLNGQPVTPFATRPPESWFVLTTVSTDDCRANNLAWDRQNPQRAWGGELAEVITYDRALSDSELAGVESYLMDPGRAGRFGDSRRRPTIARSSSSAGSTVSSPRARRAHGPNSASTMSPSGRARANNRSRCCRLSHWRTNGSAPGSRPCRKRTSNCFSPPTS